MRRGAFFVFCLTGLLLGSGTLRAQEIDARTFSNAPIGVNVLSLGAAQVRTSNYTINTQALSYNHIFDFIGQSAKFTAVLPYAELHGSTKMGGQVVNASLQGFSDPILRVAANLYGAPALTVEQFKSYQQDLIIGANLSVLVPYGRYNGNQLINVGTNRTFVQPGLGASQASGPWRYELSGNATFFSNNDDYYGGNVLSQNPVYSTTGHLIYYFPATSWLSLDATYYSGGQTFINGRPKSNSQENWLIGATFSIPVNKHNAIKFHGSEGAHSSSHQSYTLYGLTWQYIWGPGL